MTSAEGRLTGKVALITGAGTGIGRATAHLFAEEGAEVVIAEIDRHSGTRTADEITGRGGQATFLAVDVTDEASVGDAIAEIGRQLGRLHVLHNNAGGATEDDQPLHLLDEATWDRNHGLNLKSVFFCCKHAIPLMESSGDGGSIVNMSSVVVPRGAWPQHAYAAAKGGVVALTRALAARVARMGIRVNAIAPGVVLTERIQKRINSSDSDQVVFAAETVADLETNYPFSIGRPEDIAQIALFLASDASRMINGTVIHADGGLSAY